MDSHSRPAASPSFAHDSVVMAASTLPGPHLARLQVQNSASAPKPHPSAFPGWPDEQPDSGVSMAGYFGDAGFTSMDSQGDINGRSRDAHAAFGMHTSQKLGADESSGKPTPNTPNHHSSYLYAGQDVRRSSTSMPPSPGPPPAQPPPSPPLVASPRDALNQHAVRSTSYRQTTVMDSQGAEYSSSFQRSRSTPGSKQASGAHPYQTSPSRVTETTSTNAPTHAPPSTGSLPNRARSTTASSSTSTRKHRIPSREILQAALDMAQKAVERDGANDIPDALAMYRDAVSKLRSVMGRVGIQLEPLPLALGISEPDEREKEEIKAASKRRKASGSGRSEEEGKTLKGIVSSPRLWLVVAG